MIAVPALILLAHADGECPSRLGGGATLVRPVGTFEAAPFELLGPAVPITVPPRIRQTGAEADGRGGEPEQPPEQCPGVITIV